MTSRTLRQVVGLAALITLVGCSAEPQKPIEVKPENVAPVVEEVSPDAEPIMTTINFDPSTTYLLARNGTQIELSLDSPSQEARVLMAILQLFPQHLGHNIQIRHAAVIENNTLDLDKLSLAITPPSHTFFAHSRDESIVFRDKALSAAMIETMKAFTRQICGDRLQKEGHFVFVQDKQKPCERCLHILESNQKNPDVKELSLMQRTFTGKLEVELPRLPGLMDRSHVDESYYGDLCRSLMFNAIAANESRLIASNAGVEIDFAVLKSVFAIIADPLLAREEAK